MHPNVYLTSLWRAQTLDQVFVAMSFEPKFKQRYDEVLVPAIEDQPIAGHNLRAYRVDNSHSGDLNRPGFGGSPAGCVIALG